MLPAAALTEVMISDHCPLDRLSLVLLGYGGDDQTLLASDNVLALARLVGVGIDGAQVHVVAEFAQMTPVAKPNTRRRYVIGGALPLGLNQDWHI